MQKVIDLQMEFWKKDIAALNLTLNPEMKSPSC